ncbi:MAG: hypothetical protein QF704_07645 [Anaerolineales bacterium]|jgi:hypothetical protein|nr:hypothetical protein [Anaerolineales bacterium]
MSIFIAKEINRTGIFRTTFPLLLITKETSWTFNDTFSIMVELFRRSGRCGTISDAYLLVDKTTIALAVCFIDTGLVNIIGKEVFWAIRCALIFTLTDIELKGTLGDTVSIVVVTFYGVCCHFAVFNA